ncbi:MAG: acyl-CoA thioesterase [Deltaproteobacteria bacterium]|nr:acyl-CoA thioesterase [Deltaproteobacteria bacterium]
MMHREDFKVRDSEIYMGGVVHNAQYLNYLEHARNTHLRENGIDFFDLVTTGIKFAQVSSQQEYKYPLQAKDDFYVTTKVFQKSPIQFLFEQHIYLEKEDRLVMNATTVGVLINGKGQPIRPPQDLLPKLEALMEAA